MGLKPTDPVLKLLDRSQSLADARSMIKVASPLLQEIVNYSTSVYMRCMHAVRSSSKDLPAFTLYLHIIEMTDGIEVLISQGCGGPIVPLLRSSFEAYMSLRYLLQEDYENRSVAWMYLDQRTRMARYQQLDPCSQRGEQLRNAVDRDRNGFAVPEVDQELLRYIRELPGKGGNESLEHEYKRTRKERGIKNPEWFTLFDGPQHRQELAKSLLLEGFYIILYRPWADLSHAKDSSRYTLTLSDGTMVGRRLRFPRNLSMYAALAGHFLRDGTDAMLMKFRPSEPYHAKWTHEIRDRLAELHVINVKVASHG